MSEKVLATKGLTKHYGDFVAVEGLDLTIRRGEVFGLLGPNGSGKTTTILMLLGLTEPTAGSVRVLGLDPTRKPLSVKAHVGYMPDQIGFYDNLTGRENLSYIARLNGLRRDEAQRRIEAAAAEVGLADRLDQRVGKYSHGMRQRLGVADVLIKQPRLIIMDEPTQGLDPTGAHEFLDKIRALKSSGITVLLASHHLDQVQAVCDRVGLFHRGRMALEGTVHELARHVLGTSIRIQLEANAASSLDDVLRGIEGVNEVHCVADGKYELSASADLRAEAAQAVIGAGGHLKALNFETPSLNDVYTRYFQTEGNHDSGS